MNTALMFSAKSDDWSTPENVYSDLNKEFMFTCDPCPLQAPEKNALFSRWTDSVFVNPPYSNIYEFMNKALLELRAGNCHTVVFLVPARTDTKWWHEYVLPHAEEIRFIRGRLRFGNAKNKAPFPSCVVVFSHKLSYTNTEGEK